MQDPISMLAITLLTQNELQQFRASSLFVVQLQCKSLIITLIQTSPLMEKEPSEKSRKASVLPKEQSETVQQNSLTLPAYRQI